MDLRFLEQLTRTYEHRTIDEFLTAWEDVKRAAPDAQAGSAASTQGATANPTLAKKRSSGKPKRRQRHRSRQRHD